MQVDTSAKELDAETHSQKGSRTQTCSSKNKWTHSLVILYADHRSQRGRESGAGGQSGVDDAGC